MVRVLLKAGTLHRRCIWQAQRTVSLWQNLATDLDGAYLDGASSISDTTGHDLQRLSDAASHLGLAAVRYGDRRTAADAWQLSRRVAGQGLGRDQSRVARADNNLAALAAETGHGEQARRVIAGVRQTRLALLERQPQDAAAWRRLTVADRTRTDVARINGEAVESVRLAADLLADRQARLATPGTPISARPGSSWARPCSRPAIRLPRRHLEEAADTRRSRVLPTSSRVQEDLIWLAKAALVLRHPRTVLELLAAQTAETDSFRDQVSFRLGYTARRLLALASGELGRADEAAATLLAGREELSEWPLDAGLDPLAADFDRSLAELALLRGEAADAASVLTRLAGTEAEAMGEGIATGNAGPPLPAHGWTLVLLARAATRLGDAKRAAECFHSVTDLAAAGIDPCHPVILTARYDEAERCAAIGDTGQAAKLLTPVLDRTLLAHGRPALGEAHPLLTGARAMAERLGITVPYPASGLDEASLDIDV